MADREDWNRPMKRKFIIKLLSLLVVSMLLWRVVQANQNSLNSQIAEEPMRLGTPIKAPVEGDRGKLKVLSPWSGRLVHAFSISKGHLPSYLALHTIHGPADEYHLPEGVLNTTLTYLVKRSKQEEEGYSTVFDPQFSPNGRYILFKYGEPTSMNGTFNLYVLDTETSKLKLASPESLTYRFVSWSPDNRYIAFITGGDAEGNITQVMLGRVEYTGPLKLYVCDWRTGNLRLVASNDTLRGPFSWVRPHTLFYGVLPKIDEENLPKSNKSVHLIDKSTKILPQRPDIFRYSIETGKSLLVTHDGYRPTSSLGGQWIAFYGSEHPDKPLPLRTDWENDPQGAALSIAHSDGTNRIALNQEGETYPFVFWLPDNRHLLTIQQIRYGIKAQAEIKEWDVETQRFRVVCTVEAHDFKPIPRTTIEPQFLPLQIAQDGTTLFLISTEVIGHDPDLPADTPYDISRHSLEAIDLHSGKITTIAQTIGALGVDWHEDTAPVMSTIPAQTKTP